MTGIIGGPAGLSRPSLTVMFLLMLGADFRVDSVLSG